MKGDYMNLFEQVGWMQMDEKLLLVDIIDRQDLGRFEEEHITCDWCGKELF